LDADVNNRD